MEKARLVTSSQVISEAPDPILLTSQAPLGAELIDEAGEVGGGGPDGEEVAGVGVGELGPQLPGEAEHLLQPLLARRSLRGERVRVRLALQQHLK